MSETKCEHLNKTKMHHAYEYCPDCLTHLPINKKPAAFEFRFVRQPKYYSKKQKVCGCCPSHHVYSHRVVPSIGTEIRKILDLISQDNIYAIRSFRVTIEEIERNE